LPGYNEDVNELRAAKAWGLTLREWCAEDVDDRGRMLAFVLYEAKIESYRAWWREERRKKEEERENRDDNTWSKLKQRMAK